MDIRSGLIRLNNAFARRRLLRVEPAALLVLVPHCLQSSACERKLLADPDRCGRCGRCNVNELLRLRDEHGFAFRLVAGGREAVAAVKNASVKGVIAIACEKELMAGLVAAFPKPVWALPNLRPNGWCRDTQAPFEEVEVFLREERRAFFG